MRLRLFLALVALAALVAWLWPSQEAAPLPPPAPVMAPPEPSPAPREPPKPPPVVAAAPVPPPPPPAKPQEPGRACPDPQHPFPPLHRPSLIESGLRAHAAGDSELEHLTGKAFYAHATGDDAAALGFLRKAVARAPDDAGILLAAGRALADAGELDDARELLGRYLRAFDKDDPEIAMLRERLKLEQRLISMAHETLHDDGLSVTLTPGGHTDVNELVRELHRALDDAARLTGAPRRKSLHVVVYGRRIELMAVTCVPAWSGGLFDGTLRLVAENVTPQVIRHEALHATLNPYAPRTPLWFNEGLAQWFAQETSPAHERAFRMMVANHTWIPFSSLEGSFMVFDQGDDAGLAYYQSLAMVEQLVLRQGEGGVARAVELLRAPGDPRRVLDMVGSEADLLDYLARRH